jgi:hypothetical protein
MIARTGQLSSNDRRNSSIMEERLCFVARLLDGEAMTEIRVISQDRLQDFRSLQGAPFAGPKTKGAPEGAFRIHEP